MRLTITELLLSVYKVRSKSLLANAFGADIRHGAAVVNLWISIPIYVMVAVILSHSQSSEPQRLGKW
jgi:hypothetical protein